MPQIYSAPVVTRETNAVKRHVAHTRRDTPRAQPQGRVALVDHACRIYQMSRCDRCDGLHPSKECPHYRWGRGQHEDAQVCPEVDRPPVTPEAPPIEARGHLKKQPPDGSCLYHSLVHGAKRRFGWKQSATALRKQLAAWVASRGVSMRWNGKSLQQWLQFEVAR